MVKDELDYTEYEEAPADDAFAKLAGLVSSLADANAEVAQLEAKLKDAKAAVKTIEEESLPEKMTELGLKEVTLRNGLTIKITQRLNVSLPKKDPERYERGLQWFRANGFEKIIKNKLVAEFGKGKADKAREAAESLQADGFAVNNMEEIHHQTLKAFFSKWLEEGNDAPDDIFNIHRVDVAKVK